MAALSNHRSLAVCLFVTFILCIGAAGVVSAEEPVSVCPHKIVLNAEGNSDDVQAIVHLYLPSADIVSFDVVLLLDGVEVATAESAFYCLIDNNLIVGFDRQELQDNADVAALANEGEVVATVEGSVVVMAGGVPVEKEFSGSDLVEVVKPGKK